MRLDEDEDINASNYYGIHSLKREKIPFAKRLLTLNRKKIHIPIPNEEKIAKKEREKQAAQREKKEKEDQKLFDKEAKQQIKKELQKQEQELKKQEQELQKKKRQEVRRNTSVNSSNRSKITYVNSPYSDKKIYNGLKNKDEVSPSRYDILLSKSSSSKGIFGKLMASFSSGGDRTSGIPASVSFVSSTEEVDNDDRYAVRKPKITTISGYKRAAQTQEDGNLFFGVINDIGNVFGFGKTPPKDARDLRMIDSEISSSADEYDSLVSSMGYYYTYSLD